MCSLCFKLFLLKYSQLLSSSAAASVISISYLTCSMPISLTVFPCAMLFLIFCSVYSGEYCLPCQSCLLYLSMSLHASYLIVSFCFLFIKPLLFNSLCCSCLPVCILGPTP
ncbi:hypothetical protein ILYODFUR_029166 [Ilyodon furcidens]|uniref:Uncharacterized protein n=1 Tax=Ilyodon furcidens TaxID=33524 RepID=A0ABV0TZ77_9TELE